MAVAEHTPGPIEQQLLQQVAGIIRRCEDELLNSFEGLDAMAPALTDRRSSIISTASTISTRPDATTMSAPSDLRDHAAVDASGLWQQTQTHLQSTPPQPGQITQIPTSQTPSSDWIDWDVIFPPGCDGQLPDHISTGLFMGFSEPMWTRT